MFVGESHDDGGIPSKVVETGQILEIEGDEYYICRDAYNADKEFSFEGKTNKQILDTIYTDFSCKLIQAEMSAGDFIICKIVVKDTKKHNRNGTVKSILNEMQGEKSCRVETGNQRNRRQGGGVSGSELKFVEKLGGNDYYNYKDSQIMVTPKIDDPRFAEPKAWWVGDRKFKTMASAKKHIDGKMSEGGGIKGKYFEGELSFLNW